MKLLDNFRRFRKRFESTRSQKWVMRITLILVLAVYLSVVINYPSSLGGGAYLECDKNSVNGCDNPMYACTTDAYNPFSCTSDMMELCIDNPVICSQPVLEAGEVLGTKPPIAVQLLPMVVAILLFLGVIARWLV